MIYDYKESKIKGVFELFPKVFEDNRGKIVKAYHKESFLELGLNCDFGEILVTTNFKKDVIRGLHFQNPPYCQAKSFCCALGSFFDVVVDIRKGSPTYGQFDVFEISSKKNNLLYVPEGMAQGYCILEDNTIVAYQLTSKYMPEYDAGLRYDCIAEIPWPVKDPLISDKDLLLPYLINFDSPFVF